MNIIELLNKKERKKLIYRKLDKGDVLFRENDRCEHIGIMIKGEVLIISYLPDGKRIIYNILKKDGIFGNNLIFSSEPFYKGDIIAECQSEICLINKDDLVIILQDNPDFLKEYLKIQSDSSKALNSRIRLLTISSAEERFRCYMYENRNRITYDSIQQLADRMYMTRETLTRLLSRLKKNNSIIRENKVIILR